MTSRTKVITGFAIFLVVAVGLALFYRERRLMAACKPVSFVEETKFRAAADYADQANKAISSRNYSTASDLIDMAIKSLGNAYQLPGEERDDTEMTLEAGKAETARSEFQLAVRMKQSAIQTRLSMFRRKQHLSQRCQSVLGRIGL
jgi:hypothetical protein